MTVGDIEDHVRAILFKCVNNSGQYRLTGIIDGKQKEMEKHD